MGNLFAIAKNLATSSAATEESEEATAGRD